MCCFHSLSYFDYIQEKYKISDEIFDWFDFMMNACSLFGIIPGLLLKVLNPKKSAILGGLLVVAAQMATALMVSSEHEKIKENPAWMLGAICVTGG